MTAQDTSAITTANGLSVGPYRRSANTYLESENSIHNDAVAGPLGFRGGTVAGTIHMDLFTPLLLQTFGQRWFEQGSLSLYFLNATVNREAVRATLEQPGAQSAPTKGAGTQDAGTQVRGWIERDDGLRVAEGSASVGPAVQPTALEQRPLTRFEPGELRILRHVAAGEELATVEVSRPSEVQQRWLEYITEPNDWFKDRSPWGGAIANPAAMGTLGTRALASVRAKIPFAVGLYGAIQVRLVNGPVFVDTPYLLGGRVLALGDSPKSEYLWYEATLTDHNRNVVATWRNLNRWMKASSPVWQE